MSFPKTRMRRLRATAALRGLVRETELDPARFVLPLFVSELAGGDGRPAREPIATMPGVDRLSVSAAVAEAGEAAALGIAAVLLFGVPAEKDEHGSGAWDEEGVVQTAIRAIKLAHPGLLTITDVCLCEYTDHGHCGVLREDGSVDNDATLELLADTALSHARAGADVVAPSDMMDGRVGALRAELDAEGFADTPILAYSAKFASAFYGPFREAADSAPAFGDRRGYQMDPGQRRGGRARGATRRAGGRRHRDGQAGARLRRRDRARSSARPACRSPRTTSAASTRWSRPPRPPATSTSARRCSRSSPRCAARAPTRSSPTTPRTQPDG